MARTNKDSPLVDRIGNDSGKLYWRVNTTRLLREVMNNPTTSILHIPINIFQNLLKQVAERAIEINDYKLNRLMMMLQLYSISDPDDKKEYNPDLANMFINNLTEEDFKKAMAEKENK